VFNPPGIMPAPTNSNVLCLSKVNGIGDWFILMMKYLSLHVPVTIGRTISINSAAYNTNSLGYIFAFLFLFAYILTMSLLQAMNCLWWRFATLQADLMLRLLTLMFLWMFLNADIFSNKVNCHPVATCLVRPGISDLNLCFIILNLSLSLGLILTHVCTHLFLSFYCWFL